MCMELNNKGDFYNRNIIKINILYYLRNFQQFSKYILVYHYNYYNHYKITN